MRSRPPRVFVSCLAALALVVLIVSPASGGRHQQRTVVGCAVGFYSAFSFRSHPSSCKEYRDRSRAHAYEIWMKGLRWRNWGGRRAFAKGHWLYINMGAHVRGAVHLKASHRVFACGRRVYTRLRIRSYGTGLSTDEVSTHHIHLPRC